MATLTDTMVGQMLNALDPAPVNPTREQKFLAFLICKNLADLCETGQSILLKIKKDGHSTDNLPDYNNIGFCRKILKGYYSDDMFIEDEELGSRPNWKVVENFTSSKTITAFKIFRALSRNIVGKNDGNSTGDIILKAIESRDRQPFVDNFDEIFKDVPLKSQLDPIKNFVAYEHVSADDQNYVWDFFDTLINMFLDQEDLLDDFKDL